MVKEDPVRLELSLTPSYGKNPVIVGIVESLDLVRGFCSVTDIPHPLDITLKAFQTRYVKAAEYIIGNKIVIEVINLVRYIFNIIARKKEI